MSKTTLGMVNRIFADDDLNLGLSEESKLKANNYKEVFNHYYFPVSRSSLEQEFYDLLFDWRSETRHLSSITEIAMNQNYQKIIGMGRDVIPLLLRQLERQPEQLFWALKAITREDPIQPSQRGKMKEMAQVWLKWASENGYKW